MDVAAFSKFFALLSIAAATVAVATVSLMVAARFSPTTRAFDRKLKERYASEALWFAWLVATTSTLGSLYYSEVANFLPCKLCWYQRIAMYPLTVILGIAAFKRDGAVRKYVLPLASIGAVISAYHYLLERFPSLEGAVSCDPTNPCTLVWVWEFHFISIPFMALSGFAAITAVLVWSRSKEADPT